MRSILALALLALASGAATQTAAKKDSGSWVIGIARFSPESEAEKDSALLDVLPRLIVSRLSSLPPRLAPEAESEEARLLAKLRAQFVAGTELAARLDARALEFLDPGTKNPETEIAAADKQIEEAKKKLDKIGSEKTPEATTLQARLWEGHKKGELVDMTGGLPATAKASSLDFLVAGSVSFQADYAIARLKAYDASLERETWTWRGACSINDPAPLADEIAAAIERQVAGRDYARLSLRPDPPSAALTVGGEALAEGARIAYIFAPGEIAVRASAPGFAAGGATAHLALGERLELPLALAPLATGKARIETDPPSASISIDSIPIGSSPLEMKLDGRRAVVTATAPGRERADAVLPSAGEAVVRLDLAPEDGLGPGGRVMTAKNRFYKAFGWFFLSLPAATLAAGSYSARTTVASSAAEPERFLVSRYISGGAMIATIGASAGLAVNAVIRLVAYLRSAR